MEVRFPIGVEQLRAYARKAPSRKVRFGHPLGQAVRMLGDVRAQNVACNRISPSGTVDLRARKKDLVLVGLAS